MKVTFFVHIFQMDVKELSQSFSMLELQENVSSHLARIIPNLDASGE